MRVDVWFWTSSALFGYNKHSRTKQMAPEEAFGDHHTRWNIVPRSTPPLDDLMH